MSLVISIFGLKSVVQMWIMQEMFDEMVFSNGVFVVVDFADFSNYIMFRHTWSDIIYYTAMIYIP